MSAWRAVSAETLDEQTMRAKAKIVKTGFTVALLG
jgi:hypothetical protein